MGKSKQIKSSDAGHNTAMKRDRNPSSQVESMKVKSVNGISKSQEQDKSVGKSSKKQKKAMPSPSESSTESESDDQSQIGSETSDSETDESDQSDDESIDESSADNAKTVSKPRSLLDTKGKVSKVVTNGTKSHMIREAVETNETDGTTSDATSSDSSDDDTDSGKVGANAGVAPYTNGVTQNDRKPRATQSPSDDEAVEANAGSDSSSDEDDDNSSTGSSEDEGAPANATLKRKADAVQEPVAKKLKTVEATKPKNLFVGNLSWNVDEEWLRREFESFGEVVGCRIVTDRDSGRSKGFGYVDFATSEEAEKALVAKKGSELDGRPMNVDFSEPRKDASVGNNRERATDRSRNFGDVLSPPSDTLFIANLSFETTAENLKENFEEFGSITRISLPTHPDSGQLKGFGYIGFSCIDEAQAALDAWKGESLLGRPIRVDFSTPRPDGGFGASRGGRGGSFRGRGGADHGGRRGAFRGAGSRGRGAPRGGRGGSTNRGGVGDFSGKKMTF